MKAFILDRYGSADRVRAGAMPDPEPREDEVLVQVHAAGVNLLDSKIRNGEQGDAPEISARAETRWTAHFHFRPPDAAFARSIGASWVVRLITGALSYGIRAKAKRRRAHYSFLFMRANGGQLTEITSLIDDGVIRPVVDRVFPFASTKEAMAYVETGRAKGKVVVSLR
jgi:NADPH:quinone reductase-like Zn-dependent oxidoreductase